jgi:hypothetical protein
MLDPSELPRDVVFLFRYTVKQTNNPSKKKNQVLTKSKIKQIQKQRKEKKKQNKTKQFK